MHLGDYSKTNKKNLLALLYKVQNCWAHPGVASEYSIWVCSPWVNLCIFVVLSISLSAPKSFQLHKKSACFTTLNFEIAGMALVIPRKILELMEIWWLLFWGNFWYSSMLTGNKFSVYVLATLVTKKNIILVILLSLKITGVAQTFIERITCYM